MKRLLRLSCPLLFICLSGMLCLGSCRSSKNTVQFETRKPLDPHFTLIIMYDAVTGKKPLMKAIRKYNATLLYDYKNLNGVAISIPQSRGESNAIHYFEKIKGVLSVQKDKKMQLLD